MPVYGYRILHFIENNILSLFIICNLCKKKKEPVTTTIKKFLSAKEVTDAIGVSIHSIWRLAAQDRIRHARFGRRVVFPASLLDDPAAGIDIVSDPAYVR